jgi:hypothetical protein
MVLPFYVVAKPNLIANEWFRVGLVKYGVTNGVRLVHTIPDNEIHIIRTQFIDEQFDKYTEEEFTELYPELII